MILSELILALEDIEAQHGSDIDVKIAIDANTLSEFDADDAVAVRIVGQPTIAYVLIRNATRSALKSEAVEEFGWGSDEHKF